MLPVLIALFVLGDSGPSRLDSTPVAILSKRVGPVIDAMERTKFHLFPGVAQFRSAQWRCRPDGSFDVEIVTAKMNDEGEAVTKSPRRTMSEDTTHYQISAAQFRRIGYYIDHYEQLVPDLAELADGRQRYLDLWQGIGHDSIHLMPARGPRESDKTNMVLDGLAGAAFGLGVGSSVGALTGVRFKESQPESVQRYASNGCDEGYYYWEHFIVDVYELDRTNYALGAAVGAGAGVGIGTSLAQAQNFHARTEDARRKGIIDYDLFAQPIYEAEVNHGLESHHRVPATLLGAASGWVVGAGVGLAIGSILRSIVFNHSTTDTIELRNGSFAFDVPLISFAIAGTLQGARLGYHSGKLMEWRDALAAIKQTRITFGSSGNPQTGRE